VNLIDSSGWLEYFTNGRNAHFFASAIEDVSKLIVSTINIYEVFKKVLYERDETTGAPGNRPDAAGGRLSGR
jgi:uncharacterized protein with PIN domain